MGHRAHSMEGRITAVDGVGENSPGVLGGQTESWDLHTLLDVLSLSTVWLAWWALGHLPPSLCPPPAGIFRAGCPEGRVGEVAEGLEMPLAGKPGEGA